MLTTLIVLPAVTKLCRTRYEISGPPLDIRTLRASLPFLVLGSFLIGLANKPGFFFFGEPSESVLEAFVVTDSSVQLSLSTTLG